MQNKDEETNLMVGVRHDPANVQIHPELKPFIFRREVDPATLGLLIYNRVELPWKLETRTMAQMGKDYQRLQVVLNHEHMLDAYPDSKEPPADQKLRFLLGALLNLNSWDDVILLDQSSEAILVGVPPGYRLTTQTPPPRSWPYSAPSTQNGFPVHRVLWDFKNQTVFCTCGQSGTFLLYHDMTRLLTVMRGMQPQTNNTLVCPHKELVVTMQAKGMLASYQKGALPSWTEWIPSGSRETMPY